MIRVEPLVPGPLRQWWWRTTQHTRLAILGGVTVLVMALTAVAFVALPQGDAPRAAASPPAPSSSSSESADRPTTSTTEAAGDLAVTVTDVPAVDVVIGQDATQRVVQVKVAGIAPISSCWATEALSAAAELLRGKQVVAPGGQGAAPDQAGRIVAAVLLPDGSDYAQAVVGGGLARTDPNVPAPNGGDLATAETSAQQAAQGAWRPCATGDGTGDGTDSVADGTTGSGPTGGTGQQPPPGTDPPDDDDPQPPTTEPTPPGDDDDVQWGVREGEPCAPEGAVGITHHGKRVVCREGHHGPDDGLRWRRG